MAKEVRAVLYSQAEVEKVLRALSAVGIGRDQVRVEMPPPKQPRDDVKSKSKSWRKAAVYGLIAGAVVGIFLGLIGGHGAMRNLARPVNADFGQVVWLMIFCAAFFGVFGALFSVGMNKLSVSPVNESAGAERPVMVINAASDEQAAKAREVITKNQGAAPIDSRGPGARPTG
ncbi:MAG: hypothetical protein JO069_03610 [Verrucomicrobia bacterium]|nr:hypothetical protein [Verrucomicrobiota bacterium]